MDAIQIVRQQLTQELFPVIADLNNQVHVSLWSNHHLTTQNLFELLPFGHLLFPVSFYWFIDTQLHLIVDAARRNLLYWTLSGASHFTGEPATQTSLFYNDTFHWHYLVPAKRAEIIHSLLDGDRIRFLSRFYLSQTQIEVEFSEIRLRGAISTYDFVYTDSKEYTYKFETQRWDVTIRNHELSLVNPTIFTEPPTEALHWGREELYQAKLQELLCHSDPVGPNYLEYWQSLHSTPDSTRNSSPTFPDLVPDFVLHPASPAPIPFEFPRNFNHCGCDIDVCHCDIHYPGTPPTPPFLELWDPRNQLLPIEGLHYNRHTG